MTEAEYEKLVDAEALEFERRIDDYADAYSFKEGVKWSRTHPSPEVLKLVEALKFYSRFDSYNEDAVGHIPAYWDDKKGKRARTTLARFKERTAGDE